MARILQSFTTPAPTVGRRLDTSGIAPAPKVETPKAPTYQEKIGNEQIAGGQKIAGSITKGSEDFSKAMELGKTGTLKGLVTGSGQALKGATEAGFGTITGASQIALAPITPVIDSFINFIKKNQGDVKVNPQTQQAIDAIAPKIQDFVSKHPDATTLTGDIVNTLLLAIGGGAVEAPIKKGVGEVLTKEAMTGAKEAITKDIVTGAEKVKGKLAGTLTPEQQTLKIQELVSPKPTVKEARIAQAEGRLIKGKEPTLFKGGTVDEVIPSDKVIKSTQTIQREIPDAAKMKEPELYTALEARTGDMAQKLKPEMAKVPVKPETITKVKSEWENVKKSQLESADASEEANVRKLQKQFDSRLTKLEKSNNMDDVWQERINYDNSVPDNVKQANTLSPESLQNKKEIWLQNRNVLNNIINDSESGLGATSRKAFSDMSDMYNAKQNLLSKAKIELKADPSKIKQFLDKHPYVKAIVTTGTIYEASKGLGIPLP